VYNLLGFQEDAINDLTKAFLNLWKNDKRQLPIVLKSPTGSGKTMIVSNFIRGLNHLPNWDEDKAFIWITFSDVIAMQSKKKFNDYFENTIENNLLTVADINNGKLQKNDILFLNWQKVVSRSADTRVLRRPESEQERKESGYYFEDFIDNTHKDNREIILIIDEAHTHVTKDLAQNIIDYINPKIILHVSATPHNDIIAAAAELNSFVNADHKRVVEEGLIKEKILVQTEEDLNKLKTEDLDELLIDLGLNKRKDIVQEYKRLNKNINPLVLIQLPNDDKELIDLGQKTKEEVVTNLLLKKGINENEIALWFDGKEKNMEFITENDSNICFMLFKLAASTGWDCPRAHILIRFREIQSETFDIQTVGRILRMPEPNKKEDYKDSPLLRTGFLFTNYERNKVIARWDEISQNKPDIYIAKRREGIQNIKLKSDYVSRIEYGDLGSSSKFQASFLKSMDNYFKILPEDILNGRASKKLAEANIELNPRITNQMIVNAKFSDFDQLSYEFKKQGNDIYLEMSRNDVEKTFNYYCFKLLKEQTEDDAKISNIARSWSPLKSAIRVWFTRVLTSDSNHFYRVFINDLNKNEASVLRPAITQAIKDYKPILQKLIEERRKTQDEREAQTFTIQEEYSFSDEYEPIETSICALDKCYLKKEYLGRKNEEQFLRYIDKKKEKIEWWFKNGDYGKEYFAIKYLNPVENAFRLFYPDWIIRFKDGRIGIFDTKAGNTALPNGEGNTRAKAKYLYLKLKELGDKYVGGIVVLENGVWYYNSSEEYDYFPGKLNENWKRFEELL